MVDFPRNSLLSWVSNGIITPNPSLSKVLFSIALSKIVVDKVPLKFVRVALELSVTIPSNLILDNAFMVSNDCVMSLSFILVIRTLGSGIANLMAGSPNE